MRCSSKVSAAFVCAIAFAGCSEANGFVGRECAEDFDCGAEGVAYCARGFTDLAGDDTPADDTDPLGVVGILIPPGEGYSMQLAGCADDGDCPSGSACYLPLEGVDPTDLAVVEFAPSDLAAGHCLVPCASASECRTDDGFTCGIPLEDELAGIPGVGRDTYCIPDVVVDPCAPNPAWNVAGTCTLTYDLVGSFAITEIPADDELHTIEPGTLVVRVPSGAGSVPANGTAGVLCYELRHRFGSRDAVFTSTRAHAVTETADAINSGTLTDGTIAWDECAVSATYCTSDPWTPDSTATGPGCLAGYNSIGDVYCGYGALCAVGQLQPGHNPQNELWTQPLHPFAFSGGANGFDGVTMLGPATPDAICGTRAEWVADKVQIPNRSPGRTWLSFEGTLRTMECTPP